MNTPQLARRSYDLSVINSGQLVNGIWMGVVLILLGIIPGVLQRCVEAVSAFAGTLRYQFPVPCGRPVAIAQPRWLARRWRRNDRYGRRLIPGALIILEALFSGACVLPL